MGINNKTEVCRKCNINPRAVYPSGRRDSYCASCVCEIVNDRIKKRTRILGRWKERKGCNHCGQTFPFPALQIDHIIPKKHGKDIRWAHLTKKDLKKELSKCQVLCSNCHAIKTWEERQ